MGDRERLTDADFVDASPLRFEDLDEEAVELEGFTDGGYWVVSRHRDIRDVSRRSDVFSSAQNCIVPRYVDEETARGQIAHGLYASSDVYYRAGASQTIGAGAAWAAGQRSKSTAPLSSRRSRALVIAT